MENSSMKCMSPSRCCAWTVLTASSPVYPLTLVSISLSCISLVSFNIFYSDNLQRKSLWRCSWSPGFEPFPTKLINNSIEMFSDFFFFFFEDILNIYFCLHWVIVAVHGLSLVVASRGYSSLCMGFSLRWLLLLQRTSSRCTGFRSCSMQAQ